MKRCFIIISLIIFIGASKNSFSQNKFLLGSFWGFPAASGMGYGNLGFEYQSKKNNAWQFSINVAAGTIGTDMGVPNRKWVTVDRMKTFDGSSFNNNSLFYSIFIEAGSRKMSGGWWKENSGTRPNKMKAFEINPGLALGRNFKLFKKIHFQLIASPKTIIAFHNDEYYDIGAMNYFYKKYTDLSIGFRIAANFCYRL
jgi:hypothetical protein